MPFNAEAAKAAGYSDEEIQAYLAKSGGMAPAASPPAPAKSKYVLPEALAAQEREQTDPASGMSTYDKFMTGAGGATRDMMLGIKGLIPGADTSGDEAERKEWEAKKHNLGLAGTAGGVAADIAMTAIPGAKLSSAVGKGVVKVLPKAAEWAARGGKVANLGTAGRAAVEGATTAGLQGDADDKTLMDRVDNVLEGGAAGGALPLAVSGISSSIRKAWKEFAPTVKAATARAADALEKTLGMDRVEAMKTAIENATPSRLPRTTAAVTQDARAGALERGARGRGNVDFAPHDEQAAEVAWDTVKKATPEADIKGGNPQEIFTEGVDKIKDLPLSQAKRKDLGTSIDALRTHSNVIANPELGRELDNVASVLANPDSKIGALTEVWDRLGAHAGQSPAMAEAREAVKRVIDDKTKGQFSNIIQGYGAAKDAAKVEEAATGIRRKFSSESGVPTTEKYHKTDTGEVVPHIQSRPLRMALAKVEKGEAGADMDPARMADLKALSDELSAHEIYKPSQSMGSPGLAGGEGTATELSSGLGWKTRAMLKPILGSLNADSQKVADEAMHDPQKFLSVMDSKRARNAPLTKTEQMLDQALRGLSREAAINTGD
jgi:hypothetical protein